jgi:hypothetical protein
MISLSSLYLSRAGPSRDGSPAGRGSSTTTPNLAALMLAYLFWPEADVTSVLLVLPKQSLAPLIEGRVRKPPRF